MTEPVKSSSSAEPAPPVMAPPPQVIYVQAPPPDASRPLSQIEQAQLDNSAAWRTTGIVSLVLLITLFFAWVIPILLIVTLVSNSSRMNRARAGTYVIQTAGGQSRTSDRALGIWALAVTMTLAGMWLLIVHATAGAVLVGLGLLGGAVALRPWLHRLRPTNVDEGH